MHTVQPSIKDPPKKGQPLNNGHISGHQTNGCSVFLDSERGQPLYKGPQCVHCSEILLYIAPRETCTCAVVMASVVMYVRCIGTQR